MEIRGKLVIIVIFAAAVAPAVFAWTFQYLRGRRVLELWGAETARLIRVEADRVDLLALAPGDDAATATGNHQSARLQIDGREFRIVRREDISKTRGLIHARQALIEDASFAWDKRRGDCEPNWEFALVFTKDQNQATLLIDTRCRRVRHLEAGAEASIAPIFDGLMTFIDEKLKIKT